MYMKFHSNTIPITVPSPSFRDSLSADCITRLETAYEAAADKTRIKALLVCNPHNPGNECYSKEVLRGLMSFCHKKNLHYISDEIFANCAFNSPSTPFVSVLSLLENQEGGRADTIRSSRVHAIWSLSKDFGSPGVRLVSIRL